MLALHVLMIKSLYQEIKKLHGESLDNDAADDDDEEEDEV